MKSSSFSLPLIENKEENTKNNIFVTQSEESSRNNPSEEHVIKPEETQTQSSFVDQTLCDLKKSLVLKKQTELNHVDKELLLKQQEFKRYEEILSQRRSQLESKHQETKENILTFETFFAEKESKRRQTHKKCEIWRKEKILNQREMERLVERLKQLQTKNHFLKEKNKKYKIFEDFLIKTQSHLPGNHLDYASESLVMPIIRRHQTLSTTHRELLEGLERMEADVEQKHKLLEKIKQEHDIKILMSNKELCELQNNLDSLKEKNKESEVNVEMLQRLSRENVEEMGRLLMAINNLADLCYLPEYGELERLNVLTKMDMVKEYILDKADTERRVRRMKTSGSVITTSVMEKKDTERRRMKTSGSVITTSVMEKKDSERRRMKTSGSVTSSVMEKKDTMKSMFK